METKYYVVSRIDGDYAWLKRTDAEEEPLFIARALLPEVIDEGTKLKYEVLPKSRRGGDCRLCLIRRKHRHNDRERENRISQREFCMWNHGDGASPGDCRGS